MLLRLAVDDVKQGFPQVPLVQVMATDDNQPSLANLLQLGGAKNTQKINFNKQKQALNMKSASTFRDNINQI